MKRDASRFRILLPALACAALLSSPGSAARAAESTLPETAGEYTWKEQQRIRYVITAPLKDAGAAIADKDYEKAEKALRTVLAADPQHNRAREQLIEIYEQSGRLEEAARLCDELTARYPDYLQGHLIKGFLALRMDRDGEAIQSFETLLQHAPRNYPRRGDVESSLAQLYYLQGQTDKAAQHGAEWLRRSNSREAHLFMAQCAMKQEKWADALPHLDKALKQTSDRTKRGEIQLDRGYALGNLKQFDDADTALTEAKAALPDRDKRLRIEYQLGLNAVQVQRYDKAVPHFKAYLLEAFREDVARSYLYALGASEQWELARVEGRAMMHRDNLSEEFRRYALDVLMRANQALGDYSGYYVFAQQLFTLTDDPRYLLEAADAAEKLKQPQEAFRLYHDYLDRSFDAIVALNYHYLAKNQGQLAESERVLKRALDTKKLKASLRHAALYELAQVYRETDREPEYFRLMEELINEQPEARFFHEYAVQLYGAGRHEQALDLFRRSLPGETDPARKFATCKVIADILLYLRRTEEARDTLNQALAYGSPDLDWSLAMARSDYDLGDFQECVDRLLPIAGDRDVCHLYIGFSFYKMGMPGLALSHLNRISQSNKLSSDERFNLFANRAYLQFDQDQDAAALADLDQALSYKPSEELSLVRLKTLTRLKKYDEAIRTGEVILDESEFRLLRKQALQVLKNHPDKELREDVLASLKSRSSGFESDVSQTVGLAHFRKGDTAKAIECFNEALKYDKANVEVYYLRGLAYYKQGDFKEADADFLSFYDRTKDTGGVPYAYWGDVGVLAGEMGDYSFGTAALEHSAQVHPYDIDSVEEAGYQYLKWNKNKEAQEQFRRAVDLYDEVLPNLKGKAAREYEENRQAMRSEYTKLDKTWGAQAYVSRTEFDTDTAADVPLQTIQGALPSQAGIAASYRPPVIGFRNERTLDVFGRVLANFEDDSWSFDEDSYQGGFGVVYKPLALVNFNTSFERLFKIGDNAEDNWLWRNLASWEYGEKPRPQRTVWPSVKLFGEVSYFLDDPERWVYFLDGRVGPTFGLGRKVLLTIPQGLGIARSESEDESGLGTYTMIGVGATLRLFEPDREYLTERIYLDLFAHYVWGEFDDTPDGFENPDFEGLVFGISLVK
jgi:tetratricopeptide (TPR) repeat protein